MKTQILRLLVGVVVLGVLLAVVWLLGTVIPLPDNVTLAIMLGVVLLFAGAVGVTYLKSLRGAASIEQSLRQQALAQFAGARPDRKAEVDELRKQFESALDALRKSRTGRTALHSLPLHVLIGPPGSGKTTMLRESGIEFPFMAGRREIRGVGGTRNCDWWFGARGIMLDTAGRYMVESEDRDEWLAFLGMIRRSRGRRAIDGAVVAISLADVVAASDLELRSHAEMLRERLDELTQQLGVVFPVYLVFTKCDQLAGFVEFFERLTKDERKQVWGITAPIEAGGAAAAFPTGFDSLYRTLARRRLGEFVVERGRKKKEKSYSFPLQFALTRDRIRDFLGLLGQANPYQESSPLRGVYFTSGTQEGTVISQLQRSIYEAAEMAIDVPPDQRKCYFVDDLFEKVVFADVGLAKPTAAARRRRQILSHGGLAAAVLLGLWLLWATVGRFGERQGELGRYRAGVESLRSVLPNPWRPAIVGEPGRLSAAFLAALQELSDKVPVRDVDGDADATEQAVRDVVHAGLRASFVAGCVKRATDGANAAFVSPMRDEEVATADYVEVNRSYVDRDAVASAWLQAFGALTGAGGPLEVSGRDTLERAWHDCLASEDKDRYGTAAQRWFDDFLVARTDARALLAVGDKSLLQVSQLAASRETARRNIGKLFVSFLRADSDRQFSETFARTRADAPALEVGDLPGTGADCFKGQVRLPAFLAEGGGAAAIERERASLVALFRTGDEAEDTRRARQLEEAARPAAERLVEVRAAAWEAFLDGLTPQPPATGPAVDRWAPRDPLRDSPVDALALAAMKAFDVAEPPAGTRRALGARHRDLRAQIDALETNLAARRGNAATIIQAATGFADSVQQIRTALDGGYQVDGVPGRAGRALARVEQRVAALLERAAVAKVRPELENGWDQAKEPLAAALNKFPFLKDQSSELSAGEFLRLFAETAPYDVLRRIAEVSARPLGDGAPMFALTAEATDLLRRLSALRAAFVADGTFGAKLWARTHNTQATRLEIKVLDGIYNLGTSRDFYMRDWAAKPELIATIAMDTRLGQGWTIKNLQGGAVKETEFRGLWSLVRLCQHARVRPGTTLLLWTFGDVENIQVGLELKPDVPLTPVLRDVADNFFSVKLPTSLFANP